MAKPVETTSRLRHEIDRGRTGAKVGFPDPAASPLGTDDEAAGAPPSSAAVREAASHEVRRSGITAPAASDESGRTITGEGYGLANPNAGPTLMICAVICIVGLFAALLLFA